MGCPRRRALRRSRKQTGQRKRSETREGVPRDEPSTVVGLCFKPHYGKITPEEFDNFLYRFLINIFASCEERLHSLAARG